MFSLHLLLDLFSLRLGLSLNLLGLSLGIVEHAFGGLARSSDGRFSCIRYWTELASIRRTLLLLYLPASTPSTPFRAAAEAASLTGLSTSLAVSAMVFRCTRACPISKECSTQVDDLRSRIVWRFVSASLFVKCSVGRELAVYVLTFETSRLRDQAVSVGTLGRAWQVECKLGYDADGA